MFEDDPCPLVSIVTPVYNGSQYVEQLIRSVLEQDYPRIEHIIIDDGSTDGGATVSVLQRYPHLRWWSQENRGQYATVNEGLRVAGGRIFTTFNADDWYHDPSTISRAVATWRRHPRFDGICGRTLRVDNEGNRLPGRILRWRWPRSVIYYLNYLQHCSLFVDRLLLVRHGILFDESFRYCGDRDWAIQLYRHGLRFYFTSQIVTNFRCHEAQMSQSSLGGGPRQEWLRLNRKYGRSDAAFWFVEGARRWVFRASFLYECLRAGDCSRVCAHLRARLRHG